MGVRLVDAGEQELDQRAGVGVEFEPGEPGAAGAAEEVRARERRHWRASRF